jgi:ribosomal protein S18 acetylase RimI-like enzyme
LRRTKATLIYRRTGNLRAVQLLLGHKKIESTVRYLGIEVDDALAIDGPDTGWLQVGESPDSIYLGQLYLAPSLQNRSIGTAVEGQGKARRGALTLDVMKNNRARLLYERLGFRVIGESKYKLKMRWQENAAGSESK